MTETFVLVCRVSLVSVFVNKVPVSRFSGLAVAAAVQRHYLVRASACLDVVGDIGGWFFANLGRVRGSNGVDFHSGLDLLSAPILDLFSVVSIFSLLRLYEGGRLENKSKVIDDGFRSLGKRLW